MSMSFRLTAAVLLCIVVAACGHSPVPGSRPQQSQAAQAALPGVAPTHAPATSYPAATPPQAQSGPLLADSTDGVHIEYNVYGHGEPAVVLIHGWACNASYWRAQLADLSSRYTTVTLDLAGHGASGSNRSDWSLAHYGDDVAAVVRKLPNRQVVLVGHLMGGPVALEAAPLIGPRVIGIIGVDTFTSLGQPPLPRPVLEKEVAPFRADFIGEMHRFVPLLFTHNTDPAFVRKVADDMSRTSPPIAIATLLGLNSVDFATLLPHVHVPIIAIDSDTGQIVNEALVRKSVPRFRLVVVKGSGQFVMLEDPHRFNPILIRAIASLASSSR